MINPVELALNLQWTPVYGVSVYCWRFKEARKRTAMPTSSFSIIDDDGDEIDVVVPGKFEVCSRCEGTGKHDHPAFSNGFTQEEMSEDPEFAEEYRAGRYDVTCQKCQGVRVVCVADEDKCTPAQIANIRSNENTIAEIARDDRSEHHLRMMECGGYGQ